MSENYLGIDVHKKWCVYTEIDSTGKVIRQSRFGNNLEEVSNLRQFAELQGSPGS